MIVVVLLMVPAYIALASIKISAPAAGERLARSLTDTSSSVGGLLDDDGTCRKTGSSRGWRCEVVDSEGSGGVTYVVKVQQNGSCWDARLTQDNPAAEMERRVSGCVERHLLPLPELW